MKIKNALDEAHRVLGGSPDQRSVARRGQQEKNEQERRHGNHRSGCGFWLRLGFHFTPPANIRRPSRPPSKIPRQSMPETSTIPRIIRKGREGFRSSLPCWRSTPGQALEAARAEEAIHADAPERRRRKIPCPSRQFQSYRAPAPEGVAQEPGRSRRCRAPRTQAARSLRREEGTGNWRPSS